MIGKQYGFSLYEMLLSVAVIAILAGIGIPVFNSYQTRNDLDVAAQSAVQAMRRAQTLSQAGEGDSTWGVYATTSRVVLFRGASFATRNSGFDEVYDTTTQITASGMQEIVFSRLSGEPVATGTLILTSRTNEQRSISVNEKGTISF